MWYDSVFFVVSNFSHENLMVVSLHVADSVEVTLEMALVSVASHHCTCTVELTYIIVSFLILYSLSLIYNVDIYLPLLCFVL